MNYDSHVYSYDLVIYEGHSYPQSHPDHLATLGRLFGLTPQDPRRCRVLELGCACGTNLVPMAFRFPKSEFIGVDLSRKQLEVAEKTTRALGLSNIVFHHMDLLNLEKSFGKFDYIIAHGVFSWVSDERQEKILTICKENLKPNGIAYVSYNTYPGWHMREMIRHMTLYHTERFQSPGDKTREARALVNFLAHSVSGENDPYALLLRRELELITQSRDSYIFHEFLEEQNSPIYFHQFIDRAGKHGLQYLAEADLGSMLTNVLPQDIAETVEGISKDMIAAEQYMDFLKNRLFRQTLLCHDNIPLSRILDRRSLKGLLIGSRARPEKESVDLTPEHKEVFRTPEGTWTRVDFPLTKAALMTLSKLWPKVVTFKELFHEAWQMTLQEQSQEAHSIREKKDLLAEDLLFCFAGKVIELHACPQDFVTVLSEKPRASRLAAYQASIGAPIVNLRHETVDLEVSSRYLLMAMDGNKNMDQLADYLSGLEQLGILTIKDKEAPVSSDTHAGGLREKTVRIAQNLAELALLIG